MLLEEARLRCERIGGGASKARLSQPFRDLHRELGLAGFFASTDLSVSTRTKALVRARRRCGIEETERQELGMLIDLGRRAVEKRLTTTPVSDHMHMAHVHVLTAQELLAHVVRSAWPHGREHPRASACQGES